MLKKSVFFNMSRVNRVPISRSASGCMNRSVAKLLRAAQDDRRKDPTLGGLLPDSANAPKGAEGLLYAAAVRYRSENREYGEPARDNAV